MKPAANWLAARTVGEWLVLRCQATPEADAFRHETAAGTWAGINWSEFLRRVQAVQAGLHAAGLRRGDRLALVLPASLNWELLHHAALGMGIAVVGLDAHDLPQRLADMASQADVAAIALADAALWRRLQDAGLGPRRLPLLISVGSGFGGEPAAHPLETLLATAPGQSPAWRPACAEDVATVIFTSGTTGAPKGIAYTHSQLCLAVDAIADAFDFASSGSRLLCWLPLSNLLQRVVNLAGLRQGAVTSMLGDPRRVMDVVAWVEPDVFIGVPRFYEKLLDGIRANIAALPAGRRRAANWAVNVGRACSALVLDGRPLPPTLALQHRIADRLVLRRIRGVMGRRLQCMVTGSAPLQPAVLRDFHALGWTVLEAYGLSENVLPMALNRLADFRFGSVGRPLAGNHIVVDGGGQLRVRGAGVFSGYLGRPPTESLDAEGFYATGDLGHLDADGYLHLTGRSNDMLKTSTGRRVAPVAVEARLRAVPGIDQAVLLGAGRKALVALCTLNEPGPDTAGLDALLREAAQDIAEHERPAAVGLLRRPFSIEAGELTPNLKLRRSSIEQRHTAFIDVLYIALDARAGRQLQVLRE